MTTERRPTARANHLAIWALLLLALVAALPALAALPARARANAGSWHLNRGLAGGEPAELERATAQLADVSESPVVGQRAWRGLGLAAMTAARDDDALAAWQQIDGGAAEVTLWGYQAESAGDWAAARDWHRLAVRLDPHDGDAWYEVARASAQLGDAAATEAYQQALAAARHARFGPSNILTRLGELAKNAAPPDWAAALSHFEDALRRDAFIVADDRLQAHLGRAEALDKLGQTAAALDAYRQAAAAWPNHYWANVHSGRLSWYVAGDATQATTFLNHAITLQPDDKWAYLFLGGIYAEAGQADRAIPLLQRVLELDPGDATARQQLDQLMGGMALKTEVKPSADGNSSVNRLAVGAGISLVGVVLGRGLEFVKQVALARLLGLEAFGLYALGWNLLRSIGILLPLGLQNGVLHFGARFWRQDEGGLRSVLTRTIGASFLSGCLVTLVLFLAAPWLMTDVFDEPEFTTAFRVFTLMLPFMGALRVAANATRISQRMQYSIAAEEIVQSILNIVLFALLYLLGWQLMGAVVSTVLSYVAALALALYFVRRLFRAAFRAPSRPAVTSRQMLAFSVPTSLADISGVIVSRADRLFLGFYWPSAEVGIYQAAAQIAIILAAILSAFNMILMPMIADQFHKKDMGQLEELYRVNTKWGIYCIAPLVLVILFAAEDVMRVTFGAAFVGGATTLLILTVGQFVNIATGATGTILIMTGHQTAWFRLSLVVLVANLALNLTLVPRWGMIGAAIATATTVGGLFTISLLIVKHSLDLWPYDRRYLKGIAAGLATAVLLLGVRLLGLSSLANLLLTATVAVAGFFGLLILLGLDPEDRDFIALLMRRVRAR